MLLTLSRGMPLHTTYAEPPHAFEYLKCNSCGKLTRSQEAIFAHMIGIFSDGYRAITMSVYPQGFCGPGCALHFALHESVAEGRA